MSKPTHLTRTFPSNLPPPTLMPHTRAPPTPPRRRVPQHTIPSPLAHQLHHLRNILLMLEFRNAMFLPDMLDQRLDIATNRHLIRMARAQNTRVLAVCAVAMTLYDEAV
jgi:hypothetical protein